MYHPESSPNIQDVLKSMKVISPLVDDQIRTALEPITIPTNWSRVMMVDDNTAAKKVLTHIRTGNMAIFFGNYHNLLQTISALQRRIYRSQKFPSSSFLKSVSGSSMEYLLRKPDEYQRNIARTLYWETQWNKIEQSNLIGKLLIGVDYRGNLLLKGRPPNLFTLKRLTSRAIKVLSLVNKTQTTKNDNKCAKFSGSIKKQEILDALSSRSGDVNLSGVLIPANLLSGLRSADQWEIHGIPVNALGGKSLKPRFGVFSPTRQDYIDAFASFMQKNFLCVSSTRHHLNSGLVLEVGVGCGVLSFLLANMGFSVVGIDSNIDAVKCARDNAAHLNLCYKWLIQSSATNVITDKFLPKIHFSHCDIFLDSVKTNFNEHTNINPASLNEIFHENGSQMSDAKFELIVCNPPWIPEPPKNHSFLTYKNHTPSIQSAVKSSSNGTFISQLLMLASEKLAFSNNANLVLLYSSLAYELGLQDARFIEDLCQKKGFRIVKSDIFPSYSACSFKKKTKRIAKRRNKKKNTIHQTANKLLYQRRTKEKIIIYQIQR